MDNYRNEKSDRKSEKLYVDADGIDQKLRMEAIQAGAEQCVKKS